MDNTSDEIKGGFEYNTGRRALKLPEYGRNVQKMVAYLKTIEDRDKRNEQARAVVKVMELLNPQVHLQDNYEQKLWDHLQIIADFELDVDITAAVDSFVNVNASSYKNDMLPLYREDKLDIDKKPIYEYVANIKTRTEDGCSASGGGGDYLCEAQMY